MPTAEKTAPPDTKDKAADKKGKKGKKSKKKLIIIVVTLVAVAGAYFFVLAPKKPANAAPQPGVVTQIEPITVNLADGHYLRIGLALQFTKDAGAGGHGESTGPDTARALDETISALTGHKVAEFQRPGGIDATRKLLTERISKAYDGKVMEVMFTQFVTQ